MITVNGKYQFQVKDLKEMLDQEPDDAVVFAIYGDEDGHHQRPMYKTATTADDSQLFLYLGDEKR